VSRPVPFALLAASTLVLAACAGSASDDTPVAIATTTPLGSVVGDIAACAGGTSETLMGPGDVPHTFSASSAQVAAMTRADLVITNGLGLEEGLTTAIAGVAADGATVLEIAPLVDPLPFGDEGGAAGEGSLDPHFWMDVARMAAAARIIGDELAAATSEDSYATCGAGVAESLLETDAQVREILATVPEDRRVLVTDHDAFGYLAAAYGYQVAGVVVAGGSTDAEPSSADLAAIVEVVRRTGTPAIFSNSALSPALIESVAAEVGTDVAVVPLYVESVGPAGSGAETYAGMMLSNASAIADALG